MNTFEEIRANLKLPDKPDEDVEFEQLVAKAMYWVIDNLPFHDGSPIDRPDDAQRDNLGTNCYGQSIGLASVLMHWGIKSAIVFEDYSTDGHSFDFAFSEDEALAIDTPSGKIHDGTYIIGHGLAPQGPYQEVLTPLVDEDVFIRYFYLPRLDGTWAVQETDRVNTGEEPSEYYWARVVADPATGTDMLLAMAELSGLREDCDEAYEVRLKELDHLIPDFRKFPKKLQPSR